MESAWRGAARDLDCAVFLQARLGQSKAARKDGGAMDVGVEGNADGRSARVRVGSASGERLSNRIELKAA